MNNENFDNENEFIGESQNQELILYNILRDCMNKLFEDHEVNKCLKRNGIAYIIGDVFDTYGLDALDFPDIKPNLGLFNNVCSLHEVTNQSISDNFYVINDTCDNKYLRRYLASFLKLGAIFVPAFHKFMRENNLNYELGIVFKETSPKNHIFTRLLGKIPRQFDSFKYRNWMLTKYCYAIRITNVDK